MLASLGNQDVGPSITLTLSDGREVTVSDSGSVDVNPAGHQTFGYFLTLPTVEDVAETCSRLYTNDQQMYGGHGELPGYLTVTHHH